MRQRNGDVYIVTGAAGHLGGAVTRALDKRGETVYALCVPGEKHVPEGGRVEAFTGDICDIGSLDGIFGRCGNRSVTVIHCAGIVSIASGYNQAVYDVNVTGTKNIVAMCEKYDIDRLVYVSSVHAIPELPSDKTMTEVDHFSPNDVVGLYAKTKAEATQCVVDYIKSGRRANIVHPSGIVGPGDFGRGHVTQLVIDFYNGELLGGVDGGYDFVDVRDVADGILACCKKGKSGECFILSGRYFKVCDILNMLHEITGKRKVTMILPLWFINIIAPLAELYYKILKKPPLYTAYSIYTLNSNARFSHKKADRELGYTTRPMRQTLVDTISWLKENRRLSVE